MLLNEFKTSKRVNQVILQSNKPSRAGDLQDNVYSPSCSHPVRILMKEAALRQKFDPERLSSTHAKKVIRRKFLDLPALSPCGRCILDCGNPSFIGEFRSKKDDSDLKE